ncbi:MAG: acetate kinase [Alphaproteobacteria bacterium 64-11]|nr:acetate/propionate family kinase [Alphaproteobacteria bacterium]OJU11399.1 MAG: acetate kinase [Alphaproteobacteria bacterium 64-11]
MGDAILTLNGGSSSLKFALFGAQAGPPALICNGAVTGLGGQARFRAREAAGAVLADQLLEGPSQGAALKFLLSWLEKRFGDRLMAAGHRVVHGGLEFTVPTRIDEAVMAGLEALVPLAPLHQPHNLAAIRALSELHPDLPQIACFDTAFHAGQPDVARRFALPRALHDEGVRRYGFHGLSYEYIAGVLPEVIGDAARARVVVAHLGSGASLCAMHGGKSIATTMGFTALDGLVMARRCGALDPGVVLYLLQQKGMAAEAVSDMLYNRSGLLGVSGISGDMRELLESDSEEARQAIELFIYRICAEMGAMAAALGGLDALVFTAGIGEHAAEIRARVCRAAGWLGIALDEEANRNGGPCIAPGKTGAWVIPTDEDLMIARHVAALLAS